MERKYDHAEGKHAARRPVHHTHVGKSTPRSSFPSSIPADLFNKMKSASGVMLADKDAVRAMREAQVT